MTVQGTTSLSRLLKRKLAERGWVAEDLAWRSEIRVSNIYRMLRGEQDNPTWETLQKLAAGLGMPILVFISEFSEETEREESQNTDAKALTSSRPDGSDRTLPERTNRAKKAGGEDLATTYLNNPSPALVGQR